MTLFALATEDELSEAVGLKIMLHVAPAAKPLHLLRRGGNEYLRKNLAKFATLCHYCSVVMLTDLDTLPCATALLDRWTVGRQLPSNFFLRVAVREVESWLLADAAAMEHLLGPTAAKIPARCDDLSDPKRFFLNLARRGPRDVRADLCAAPGSSAAQGVAYNARLCQLVREVWSPHRAAQRSPSLSRACKRLSVLG